MEQPLKLLSNKEEGIEAFGLIVVRTLQSNPTSIQILLRYLLSSYESATKCVRVD